MEQLRTCGFSFTHVRTPRPHKHASTVRTPSNARTHSHPSVSARRHRRELPHRQNGDLVRVCTLHIVPAHMCFVCACARYVRVVARRLFLCVHRAHICVREIVCACVPGLTLVWQQLRSPHHTKKRPHKIIKCQPTTSTHVNFQWTATSGDNSVKPCGRYECSASFNAHFVKPKWQPFWQRLPSFRRDHN